MSNGLKNIQSHARAYARRERLESGQPLPAYDDGDGAIGCLTPVDDVDVDVADHPYSSPETAGSTTGPHSTPDNSSHSSSSASHSHAAAFADLHPHPHHHHHHHQQQQAAYQGYGAYHHHQHAPTPQHGYSNSVSSTGTSVGYGPPTSHHQQQQQQQPPPGPSGAAGTQQPSPYLGHGSRLPSVGDMGIDAIINRGPGSQNGS